MDEFFSGSVTSDQDRLHYLKKYLFESGLKEATRIPMHAYPPGFFCRPLECCRPAQNIKIMCDPANSNCGSLVEDLRSAGSRFHPMCLKDYLDTCKSLLFLVCIMGEESAICLKFHLKARWIIYFPILIRIKHFLIFLQRNICILYVPQQMGTNEDIFVKKGAYMA